MATAGGVITASLRKIGILAEGETASAEMATDALEVMNDFIDAMALENLLIHATQDQQFTWPANNATRTLGPSGNFIGIRPVRLEPATFYHDAASGLDFAPIALVDQQEFNEISLKALTSPFPIAMFVNYTMPNITMQIWPIPTIDLLWHFVSLLELTQPAVLATVLSIPPGYRRFFKYQLAVELASEFGIEAPKTVQRIAASEMRAVKRMNKVDMAQRLPANLVRTRSHILSGV